MPLIKREKVLKIEEKPFWAEHRQQTYTEGMTVKKKKKANYDRDRSVIKHQTTADDRAAPKRH